MRGLEEIDRMLSNVAHELNNPLSGIRGAAQMLARKLADDADLAAYGTMIVRQADRMSELIRGLMKLEAPPPAFEPVNIHRVLNEVILLERAEAESARRSSLDASSIRAFPRSSAARTSSSNCFSTSSRTPCASPPRTADACV